MSQRCNETTPRCIHCSMALKKIRMQKAVNLPADSLSLLPHPELITEDDFICPHCMAALKAGGVGHGCCSCVGCGGAMNKKKSRYVPQNCPQRKIIESWLCPHHAHLKFNKVCDVCWEAACNEFDKIDLASGAAPHKSTVGSAAHVKKANDPASRGDEACKRTMESKGDALKFRSQRPAVSNLFPIKVVS